jgi:hypothetical protein
MMGRGRAWVARWGWSERRQEPKNKSFSFATLMPLPSYRLGAMGQSRDGSVCYAEGRRIMYMYAGVV